MKGRVWMRAFVAIVVAAVVFPLTVEAGREQLRQQVKDAYGKLPLAFVPNEGQKDSHVRYYASGPGVSALFASKEVVFALERTALSLLFLGADPTVSIKGRKEGVSKANYLIGNDPARWRTNLPTYREVVYRKPWPGVDAVFRGESGRLKYEFILQPKARVEAIRLAYGGAEKLSVDEGGNLLIHTALGVLTDERPTSYQVIDGKAIPVESRFVLRQQEGGHHMYGFEVGPNDPRYPLVIDPGLVYSTYLGGSQSEGASGIAVDAEGNAYVTGTTMSADFPTTSGSVDTTFNGYHYDAFVAKLDPTGSRLLYSTYLGGSYVIGGGNDHGNGIAVDAAGNAYVVGTTDSSNFPTTAGAFDRTLRGGTDAFVVKLDPTGSSLLYSTYLGEGGGVEADGRLHYGIDWGLGIAVDAEGNAYVTGMTDSVGFPTTAGAFDRTLNGFFDAYLVKLNASGTGLLYSTYLGGSGGEYGFDIAIDAQGNAYVTGVTLSSNFPTTAGAFDRSFHGGFADAFVVKLNPAGSGLSDLVYSTYLGGIGDEFNFLVSSAGIAVDAQGNAYVTGFTASPDFPTTPGVFDRSFGGPSDAFVAKLNPGAVGPASLVYSTYLGGSAVLPAPGSHPEMGFSIAVDAQGNAYVTGFADSMDFPTTPTAISLSGTGFVVKLDPAGSSLLYSTRLVGFGTGIAVDTEGNASVTGAVSGGMPITAGAFDETFNGGSDAFVTKLDLSAFGNQSPVITSFTATPASGTVPLIASFAVGAFDPDGTIKEVRWDFDGDGTVDQVSPVIPPTQSIIMTEALTYLTVNTFTPDVTVVDNGGAMASAAVTVTAELNHPPVASAGQDHTVECASAEGTTVTLNGSGSSDPDGDPLTFTWTGPFGTLTGAVISPTLPPGVHTMTLTVDDGRGGTASDTVVVHVQDMTPPSIGTVTASPSVLWAPNHTMVPVAVIVSVTDMCNAQPACTIISVSSNQPVKSSTDPDWVITGDLTVTLRAERSGSGDGRVYTLTVRCADASGNSSTRTIDVAVSHDQGKVSSRQNRVRAVK